MKGPDATRRSVLKSVGVGLAGVLTSSLALGSEWSPRTIRFVTQSGPGDAVDLRLRDFLRSLSPSLKQANCIVENKPGAGGIISIQAVLGLPANGQTVLLGNAGLTILPGYFKSLPFSPIRDLTPVALSGISPNVLMIASSRPEKSLSEWVRNAKARRGRMTYASIGSGSLGHLYGYQISEQFGFDATHIAYRGSMPGLFDLMSGQIDYMMLDVLGARPFLEKKSVRPLALAFNRRSKFLPEVPTFDELGFKSYDRVGWTAYLVKSGTPATIVDTLSAAINAESSTPAWKSKRDLIWSEWDYMSQSQLHDLIQSDTAQWGELMKRANFMAQ